MNYAITTRELANTTSKNANEGGNCANVNRKVAKTDQNIATIDVKYVNDNKIIATTDQKIANSSGKNATANQKVAITNIKTENKKMEVVVNPRTWTSTFAIPAKPNPQNPKLQKSLPSPCTHLENSPYIYAVKKNKAQHTTRWQQ